jgi:hypothetical protein
VAAEGLGRAVVAAAGDGHDVQLRVVNGPVALLLFDDRVTAIAVAGMLLIAGAGLTASLLRSRGGAADIGDVPDTL